MKLVYFYIPENITFEKDVRMYDRLILDFSFRGFVEVFNLHSESLTYQISYVEGLQLIDIWVELLIN